MKLEVGKYYRTRDGRKAGPIVPWQGKEDPWPFAVLDANGKNYRSFSIRGECCSGPWPRGLDPECDLIAEWVDEPAPQPAGPVRTITRKEIVPGVYGAVSVHELTTDCTKSVWIALVGYGAEKEGTLHARLSTDELTAAIATLSEIADAMEENSK